MTDINKHLPGILQLICNEWQALSHPSDASAQKSRIMALLASSLPRSYSIGTGCLLAPSGQASLPVDIVIFDRTRLEIEPTTQQYPFKQVLLAMTLVPTADASALVAALDVIRSMKMLKGTRAHVSPRTPDTGTRNERVPKSLLPLGLICVSEPGKVFQEHLSFCDDLHHLMKQYALTDWPDYLFALQQGIFYRTPALDGRSPDVETIGLFRQGEYPRFLECYVCKTPFFRRHFFYDRLCSRCGDRNYLKRSQVADLRGRVALVTGARLRIGYATVLKLLRAGATVIATTRFPHDAARRYAQEADYADWAERLHLYGLDLRHIPGLEQFIEYVRSQYDRLDILINNAAQTVRRPPAFYAHLLPFETLPFSALPSPLQPLLRRDYERQVLNRDETSALEISVDGAHSLLQIQTEQGQAFSAHLSQVPLAPGDEVVDTQLFPPGALDTDGQQLDLRPHTSWTMKLEEVSLPELLEVQLVNVIAPTRLISQLKPLLVRTGSEKSYIVNVTAVEGQFSTQKRPYHPHTNMAKAALNMLTYTSAPALVKEQIFMNGVDPGWISPQTPAGHLVSEDMMPLDEEDAASRICDPIFVSVNGERNEFGKLFKDYLSVSW